MAKKEIIIQEEIDRITGIMKNAKLIREGFYLEDDDDLTGPETDAYDDSDVPMAEPEVEQPVAPAPEEKEEDPTKSLGGDFVIFIWCGWLVAFLHPQYDFRRYLTVPSRYVVLD